MKNETLRLMRNTAAGDVAKVWLYAEATVLLGAWWSPVLFQGGKALAEVASRKQTNQPLDWLARWCLETGFSGFFMVGVLLAALVLWVPFAESLKLGRSRILEHGQPLRSSPRCWLHGATGFFLTAGLLLAFTQFPALSSLIKWREPAHGWTSLLLRAGWLALAFSTLQEVLFRGMAMGIFLRAMRPAAAMGMSALLFTAIRLLIPPPDLPPADPEAGGLGFELLGGIFRQFAESEFLVPTVLPLLAWGCLLGYARWRTSSLWLPVGLHAGWIFSHEVLGALGVPIASGAMVFQALLPLATIAIASVAVYFLTSHEPPIQHSRI